MGIKVIDAIVVGICSKCRIEGDEIPKYKDGTIIPDKDISCINEALGSPTRTIRDPKLKSKDDR